MLFCIYQLFQRLPADDGVVAVLPDVAADMFDGEGLAQVALGVELIGIADDFLLQGLRAVVAQGDGNALALHLLLGDAAARVALCHQRMLGQALLPQQFRSKVAVLYIRVAAGAVDFRGIAEDDTDVV